MELDIVVVELEQRLGVALLNRTESAEHDLFVALHIGRSDLF